MDKNVLNLEDMIYEDDNSVVFDVRFSGELREPALKWWQSTEFSLEKYRRLREFTSPFDFPYTEEAIIAMYIGEALLTYMENINEE